MVCATDLKILFNMTRDIDWKIGDIKIGKYIIETLPSNPDSTYFGKYKYILKFKDTMDDRDTASNPIGEASLFLSFVALMMRSGLEIDSVMMGNYKTSMPYSGLYKEYSSQIESLPDYCAYFERFNRLDYETAILFLRSCEVYKAALNLIGSNNTLSYFLLCISVECLSNKVCKSEGIKAKFIDFIIEYLPDKSEFDSDKWKHILGEVYSRHRSKFTHAGESIPEAVYMADSLNRSYVKNYINGKEVKTAGLKWFEKIVRASLLGFLDKAPQEDRIKQGDLLKKISLLDGQVTLKTTKKIAPGGVARECDVELD